MRTKRDKENFRRGFALGIRTAVSILRTSELLFGDRLPRSRVGEVFALESLLTPEERETA